MFGGSRQHMTYRIPELLENLKSEFESLSHDLNVYKMQRDDYERTCKLFSFFPPNKQNRKEKKSFNKTKK